MIPDREALAAVCTAAALALSACATPVPIAPAWGGVALPDRWGEPSPESVRASAVGAAPGWWAGWGDSLLVELITAAQDANADIGLARANLQAARAARQEAAAALSPQLGASATAERFTPAGARSRNSFEAALDARWELDLFGRLHHGVQAQQALAEAGEATLAATQVSVAAEVALAYLQLRLAQWRAVIARDNLAAQADTLQISQWRQQAGLADTLEVEQAQAAAQQTRALVPALQSSAAASAHALAVLTGRTPESLLPRMGQGPGAALPQPGTGVSPGVPAVVLAQRPDLLAAQRQLDAAAQQVALADAARRPSLALAGSIAWSGLTLGSVGSVSAARSVLASLSQPVFDAGARGAQLAQRQAAFDAARERWRASVLVALQEVEDALAALTAGRDRLAALQIAEASARNAALLATQRHASGLVDFQTVLDTQRTLLGVQDAVALAQADLGIAQVRLYKAVGGGWRPAQSGGPA